MTARCRPTLSLCLVLLILGIGHGQAEPQTSSPEARELPEVVVTATRTRTPVEQVTAPVTVITSEQMARMPVSNVAEVLQYVSGVHVEFSGGLGSQAVARLQGSETRHVGVYQDGVALNQLANPLTDLSSLPLDAIDRIEIYRGTASAAWGSALGGVINIITRSPDRRRPYRLHAKGSYGEFGTFKSAGGASFTSERFGALVSLVHDRSDGFMEHTQYRQDAVYARVDFRPDPWNRFDFACSYDEGRNADPVTDAPDFWDDNRRRRTYQRLLFETSPEQDLHVTLEGRHHRFRNRIDDVYSDRRELYNDYVDETWGTSARMRLDTGTVHTLTLGFDQDWGRYDWAFFTREYATRNWALHLGDTFTLGRLTLNGGIRYDDNAHFPPRWSPCAGAVYRFDQRDTLIRAQVASGFSAPPAAWLHDPRFGNRDLKPETAVNVQAGGQWRVYPFLVLELNGFRAGVEDLIRFNTDTLRYENVDEVTRQGVEWGLRASLDMGLAFSVTGSALQVRDEKAGKDLKDIPRAVHNVSVAYTHGDLTHCLVGKYMDHHSSFPETRDKVFLFDYLLQVRLPVPTSLGAPVFFGAVHNVANTTYLYRAVFPQPDRWVEAGLRCTF